MNPSKTLRTLKRIRARYPSQQALEDEKLRESQQYYESLSSEELETLYNERMAELNNDPEVIANMERWSKMTYEELVNEYFQKLKAS